MELSCYLYRLSTTGMSGTCTVSTHNLHPSVCTSHTYLTMVGVHDCHLLQLPTQANSLQHCHRVHPRHSDLPQTRQDWKGCSYNITSAYQIEEEHYITATSKQSDEVHVFCVCTCVLVSIHVSVRPCECDYACMLMVWW